MATVSGKKMKTTQTQTNTLVSTRMIKNTVKGSFSGSQATATSVLIRMTRDTDTERCFGPMGQSTKATGSKACSTASAR